MIAIDLTSLDDNFSGIERYALCITKELIKNTTDHFLLIFKNKINYFTEEELSLPNVSAHILHGNRLDVLLFSLPKFLNSTLPNAALFFAFPPSFLVPLSKKIKIYSTIHDMVAFDMPKTMKWKSRIFFKAGYKHVAKRATKVFTVSSFSKERIHQRLKIDTNDIVVTYNGFKIADTAVNANDSFLKNLPSKYLLCLSTIEPRKNFRWLISQLDQLWEKDPSVPDLVIVGRRGWKTDNLLSGIHPSSLKRIHFSGFISDELLPYVYSHASCFLFPSIYEGFGVPLIESSSFGCLPLSSDIPSSVEVLGKNYPYFFKLNDGEDFYDKLKSILSLNNEQRQELVQSLKKTVSVYRWEASASQIIDAIKNS